MQTKTALVVLGALVSAAAIGCGSSGSDSPTEEAAAVRASLHRAADCGSLLSDLKADALYKLNRTINRQIQDIQACQKAYPDDKCSYAWGGGYAIPAYGGGKAVSEATSANAGAAAPAADSASTSGNATSATSASQTNVQVKGVDEADIVKNDTTNIYVLHGNAFKVVKAWPATDLKQASTLPIEGSPTEMFVANGKVVVYSQVNGADVFAKAGVTPKESYTDFGWSVADAAGSTGGSSGTVVNGTTYAPLSKVTVLSLDGDTAHVVGEQYFEGNYLDARRVDNHVRSVFSSYQYGPKLKYGVYDLDNGATTYTTGSQVIKALGTLRSVNSAAINGSQLADWLPYTFVKSGDKVTAQTTTCSDFYIPAIGTTQSGMTKVSSLDLGDPTGAPRETAILGEADTVYANATTMYLASRAWIEPPFAWYGPTTNGASGTSGSGGWTTPSPGSAPTPAPLPDAGVETKSVHMLTSPTIQTGLIAYSQGSTHLHKFDFATEPSFPNYVASGTVQGTIKDQFSLDEKDGNLRIATTEGRSYIASDGTYASGDTTTTTGSPVNPGSVNHVSVLAQTGPWLETIGSVGDIAPNESIQSVRFVGNRGYVTTYRQVDPLFVLDLTTPKAPSVIGALTIAGFSEYMQPIDDNHLLTIGRSGTRGLQLQIFDVTDGKNPIASKTFTYDGSNYGGSDAEYDHKAFTWFPEKGLLAFPYYSYGNGVTGGYHSSLEVFRVDINAGFSKLGSIDSTQLIAKAPQGWYCGYYGPSVRRGVFLDNFVYSVSYGGIIAKDSNNLAAAGTSLPLEAPLVNPGYGAYAGGADIACASPATAL